MEEDVEDEVLYGQVLMEAAASERVEDKEEAHRVCGVSCKVKTVQRAPNNEIDGRKYPGRKLKRKKRTFNNKKKKIPRNKKSVLDDSSTDMEELLDTHILNCVMNGEMKPNGEPHDEIYDFLEENNRSENCINDILEDGCVFRERSLQLVDAGFSENSGDKCLFELMSLQTMIDKRDDLLEKLEKKLKEELFENNSEQRQVRHEINTLSQNKSTKRKEPSLTKTFFVKFGMPYFQDSRGFTAPSNNDVKKKKENGELILTLVPRLKYWRKASKDNLQDAIQHTLIIENSDKLVNEIQKLKGKLINVSDEETESVILNRIDKCQHQLKSIRSMSYLDLVAQENPDREYDWLKYSATNLNGMHSPEECKWFWHLYLKPQVNKSRWERNEDEKLKKIAEEMNFQDWDSIAQSLGTNRTGYQCFIHYRNRFYDKKEFSAGKWTKEEDEKLMIVINSAKIGDYIPWTKVASFMGDRNHHQIYNRYVNCLDPKLVKGRFSTEEDLLIVSGIEVFGATYREIASLMSNRNSNQIRERYERHLLPNNSKTGTFSLEEDELLLKLVDKHGERNFALVADEMKTRSRTQIRQRYNCIMQTIRTKPGWTPAQVKRRNSNKVSKNFTNTRKKVEKLRRYVENIEKTFQLSKLQSESFRIEQLKELRDNIFMKKYDLKKFKKKTFPENSEINNQLLEFFKYHSLNNTVKSSIPLNSSDNVAYLNEILLLAKYFGHELQLPESEDKVWEKNNLPQNLKTFLAETLEKQAVGAACDKQTAVEVSLTPVTELFNIDYEEPEVDDTLIVEKRWHTKTFNISNLNFSEIFKRTVFDYSNGLHQDIWDSKRNRSKVAVFTEAIDIEKLPIDQPYFFPPNCITTLGYKSILLSKTRLKRDAKKLPEQGEVEANIEANIEASQIYRLQDKFQETLLSLFYCPKVLSVTDIGSTLLPSVNTKRSQCITNHQGIVELLNESNQTTSDIVRKVAQPLKDDALQAKKMKRNIQEHNKTRLRQLKEFKKGITYKRKISIEHLVRDIKEPYTTDTQVKKKSHQKRKKNGAVGRKANGLSLSNDTLVPSDSQNTNDSPESKLHGSDISSSLTLKAPCQTYSRTRQSLKRHLNSDKSAEPSNKESNSKNVKLTQPTSQDADNLCPESHSRANTN